MTEININAQIAKEYLAGLPKESLIKQVSGLLFQLCTEEESGDLDATMEFNAAGHPIVTKLHFEWDTPEEAKDESSN
jgi:hypothetical protein